MVGNNLSNFYLFRCSDSTIETLEIAVNSKETRTTSDIFYLTSFSPVSSVDFEQVNACRETD